LPLPPLFHLMHASPLPSCFLPATGSRQSGGEPLYFTPLEVRRLRFRPKHATGPGLVELPTRNHRKKRMRCPVPVRFAHGRTAEPPRCIRLARRSYFALVFCGDTGMERGSITDQVTPQPGPSGASTSPESGLAVSVHVWSVSSKNHKIW